MMRTLPLFLFLTALVGQPVVLTDSREHLFEQGNRFYQDAEYQAALDSYWAVLDSGYENAELYHNLGNCYFKVGELGRAVLSYERALRLRPGDEDSQSNLALTRTLLADEITPMPRFWLLRLLDWWLLLVPRAVLWTLTGSLYVLALAALIVRLLLTEYRPRLWSARLAVVCGFLALILGLTAAGSQWTTFGTTEAIILVDSVSVKSAPSDDSGLEIFTIHEGTKVRVDQQSGEWAEIVVLDGQVGWVKLKTLEVI